MLPPGDSGRTDAASECQRLKAENEELRARLAEATEALDAIRRGEVDAVMVDCEDGPKVYGLSGADEPYRIMVEDMQEGALTLREDTMVTYCNKQIALMLKVPVQGLLGKSFREFVAPASLDLFEAMLSHGGTGRGDITLQAADKTPLPAHLAVKTLRDDGFATISIVATDLSEEIRYQELVASEALSRAILDQASNAIVVCDEAGYIIRANHAAEQICGFKLLLQKFAKVFPLCALGSGEGKAGVWIPPTPGTDLPRSRDVVLVRPDGRRFHLLLSISVLFGDDARPQGFVAAMVDMTTRNRAEVSLRESESRFRQLSETLTHHVVHIMDHHPIRIVYASRSFEHVWQMPLSALYADALCFIDRIHPDDRAKVHEAMRAQAKGLDTNVEYRLLSADGTIRWIQDHTFALKNAEGVVYRSTGIAEDITERKLAEETLRQSESRLRLLANSMPNLAWCANADGFLTWYNDRWYEYTGTTPEQMLGWGWNIVHDPSHLPRVMAKWKASLATGEPFTETFPLRGRDGIFRAFLTRVMPLKDSEGKVQQWFGTNTDVSEQKRVEDALIDAKAAAEAANQAKSLFLANMSHEIRTPLTAITGFTSLVLEGGLKRAETRSYLHTIQRNCMLLQQIIDDILDLSKVESGKLLVEKISCSLAEVIKDVEALLKPQALQKGIYLKVVMGETLAGTIISDPTRLRQILFNIVGNAIKFTKHGGVTLTLQQRWARDDQSSGCVLSCFTVSDTGLGIGSEHVPHLFKPFAQADNSTTRRFGGSGLGLILSKRLAQSLGGDVVLSKSILGQGSTFTISIEAPIAAGLSSATVVPTSNQATFRTRRLKDIHVLVAEDSPDNQVLISKVLRSNGAKVTIASNGDDAVTMTLHEDCDIVLMDMQMPGQDGLAATAELRRRGFRKPILALSASAMTGDRDRALSAGCNEHLAKPIIFPVLLDKVARYTASP